MAEALYTPATFRGAGAVLVLVLFLIGNTVNGRS